MTPIVGLACLLAASHDSCQRRLIGVTLDNLCRDVGASAAIMYLFDGSTIMLEVEVSIRKKDNVRITYAPGTERPLRCALDGASAADRGCSGGLPCRLGKRVETGRLCSRACTPLRIGSDLVGRLVVLSDSPREFSLSDMEYINAKGRHLILRLHHTFYFPDVCHEWVALEESASGRSAGEGIYPQSLADRMQLSRSSMAYQVLVLENLNHLPSVAALSHRLPKGISWFTLRLVCEYLDRSHSSVSRKEIADAIGVSEVTVGLYLAYLVDIGLVQEWVAYGGKGRPASKYQVLRGEDARSPL